MEEVALACAAWAQLDHVVIAFDKGHHAQKEGVGGAFVQSFRLDADAAQQEVFPGCSGEVGACGRQRLQHIALGELDLAQAADAEGAPPVLLGDGCIVGQADLGVEAAGEHAFVLRHQLSGDAHIGEAQAGQRGHVGVAFGIQPCGDQVDDSDLALLAGVRFEELLFAGFDRA